MPHELKAMTDAGIQQEIDRYLATGASDDGFPGWP